MCKQQTSYSMWIARNFSSLQRNLNKRWEIRVLWILHFIDDPTQVWFTDKPRVYQLQAQLDHDAQAMSSGVTSHPICSALGWLHPRAGTTHGSKMATRNSSLTAPAWGRTPLPFATFQIVPAKVPGLALLGLTWVLWLISDMSHCLGDKGVTNKAGSQPILEPRG